MFFNFCWGGGIGVPVESNEFKKLNNNAYFNSHLLHPFKSSGIAFNLSINSLMLHISFVNHSKHISFDVYIIYIFKNIKYLG